MALEKLYTASNAMEAHLVANLLQQQAVPATVIGEVLAAAQGGLPPTPETQPSVWVPTENLDDAREIVESYMRADVAPAGPAWTCPACGEMIEGQFGQCWRCGAEREPAAAPAEKPSADLMMDDVPDPDVEDWEIGRAHV